MATQLLFYDSAVPLSKQNHADLCIEHATYAFASAVNSVPLTAVEIPRAAREYTIVFAGSDAITPVVLLGIEKDSNIYVDKDGKWTADYIPAFVRRYPFVFAMSEDGKQFTLCVDDTWAGCNREGRGKRLFDEKGERAEYLNEMLQFVQEYQAHFDRTKAYCSKLKELELLEPMKVDFTMPDGSKRSLGGFMAVNREKLKGLASEKLVELQKSDELELTYYHLLSMNNLNLVANRASQSVAQAAGEKSAAEKPDEPAKS